MTKEQAEEFMKQMQQGGGPAMFGGPQGAPGLQGRLGQQSPFTQGTQSPTAALANVQLKQGLSVTVNIVTAQRTNVLLIPNEAVARKGGTTVVSVQKNGVAEQQEVICGISDWQNTEVTAGLVEGDQVIITRTTTTRTATTPNQRPQQFFIPGGGGGLGR
jgi:HlyD family secretion protein